MYDVEAQSRGTTNLFTSLFESKQESEGKMLDSWSVMLKHNKQWHPFLTVCRQLVQFMFVSQATSILLNTEQLKPVMSGETLTFVMSLGCKFSRVVSPKSIITHLTINVT